MSRTAKLGRIARLFITLTLGIAILGVFGGAMALGSVIAGPDIIAAPASVIDDPPGATNDHQQAFDEAQGVLLPADLAVDGGIIPAGILVDSHMIFLNTEGGTFATDTQTWTFDGPILGVMSNSNGSLEVASTPILGAAGTVYPAAPFAARGMEGGDSYAVAGNQITVHMSVTEPGDWIRVVTVATTIGEIKEPTPFQPDPSGNGRAVAFDGKDLYYTITSSTNIYKVSTTGVPIATIPTQIDDDGDGVVDRSLLFGALSWDAGRGVLWGGSYDGSTEVYTIDPTTGMATLQFDETAFGGIAADSAYGGAEDSGDACATIYHVGTDGSFISSSLAPNHPSTGAQGYNTGITVAPGGYLEIAMQAGPDTGPHVIAKVPKHNPSTIVYFFVALATNNPGIEDLAYDPDTYKPRAVVWSNQFGFSNLLTAWDVQVTRTIGYWKTHPEDAEGLPIYLGYSDDDGAACTTVSDADDVFAIMKAAKAKDAADMLRAQLLAAKLNLALGDIPPADVAAIIPIVNAADELLGRNDCNPDTGNKGADRAEATDLIYVLDMFNNMYSP
jgi:hypothetical protein